MKLKNSFKPGFSLLELLVVISIIGILTTIGVVAFGNAQKKTRDAKRVSDLKEISIAQEQYYSTTGIYINFNNGGSPCTATTIPNVMDKIPSDPKNTSPYTYNCRHPNGGTAGEITDSNSDGNAPWCMYVQLESGGGNCGSCTGCTVGTKCDITTGTTGYCIYNVQ